MPCLLLQAPETRSQYGYAKVMRSGPEATCIPSQGWTTRKQMNLLERSTVSLPCCPSPGGPHSTPLGFHPAWFPHLGCRGLVNTVWEPHYL